MVLPQRLFSVSTTWFASGAVSSYYRSSGLSSFFSSAMVEVGILPTWGAAEATPPFNAWQYFLSEEEIDQVDASIKTLSSRTIVAVWLSTLPLALQFAIGFTQLCAFQRRVSEIALLGCGVFLAVLSDECLTLALFEHFPIVSDSRLTFLQP